KGKGEVVDAGFVAGGGPAVVVEDRQLFAWDFPNAAKVGLSLLDRATFSRLMFGADGKTAASGRGERVKLWHVGNDKGKLARGFSHLRAHRQAHRQAVTADGRLAVTGEAGGTITFWDVEFEAKMGKALYGPLRAHNDLVTSLAFNHRGDRLASGS